VSFLRRSRSLPVKLPVCARFEPSAELEQRIAEARRRLPPENNVKRLIEEQPPEISAPKSIPVDWEALPS
jgi:hypothetical protein